MRRPIYLLAIAFLLVMSSCKTTQVPKFTSVENLYQIELNASLDQVIALLGSKPYNILSNQIDGYTIYTYKYKLVERKVNPKIINKKGGETTGTEVYNGAEQTLFLFFKNDKLEAFVTTEGRKDSPSLVLLNNTLYTISKDKGSYILVPTNTQEVKEPSLPFKKKKKIK